MKKNNKKIKIFILLLFFYSITSVYVYADAELTKLKLEEMLATGKKPVILLIDMQKGFESTFIKEEYDYVLKEQLKLLEFASQNKIQVINVNLTDNLGNGETVPELLTQLKQSSRYKIFHKETMDAFKEQSIEDLDLWDFDINDSVGENLGEYLSSEGIDTVVTTGCYDQACVYLTAEGALEKGYNVLVDRDMNILFKKEFLENVKVITEDHLSITRKYWKQLEVFFGDKLQVIDTNKKASLCQSGAGAAL